MTHSDHTHSWIAVFAVLYHEKEIHAQKYFDHSENIFVYIYVLIFFVGMSHSAIFGFAAGLGAAAGLFYLIQKYNLRSSVPGTRQSSLTAKADRFRVENGKDGGVLFEEYIPPLPLELKEMLSEAQLCHLSCIDEGAAPHTSLMNFTFVEDGADSLIIMTTRTDTKKYVLMGKNPTVGLLLHDFPQIHSTERSFKRTLSISITGSARIEKGEDAERYRNIHLQKNMQYSQFIEGKDKAVVTIKIMQARMCNIQVCDLDSRRISCKKCKCLRSFAFFLQDHVTSWTRSGS
jgi:nitroimidazol reductase NimA-like FMN-containing flavoprotein (pyridoxamine 5'-phosphate oxidase superfamily)